MGTARTSKAHTGNGMQTQEEAVAEAMMAEDREGADTLETRKARGAIEICWMYFCIYFFSLSHRH
jgi:hypothetical protein